MIIQDISTIFKQYSLTFIHFRTLILFTVGIIFFKAFTSFLGLIMYAHYMDCDPLTAGYIQKVDQILPYYIMDVTSTLPGLPGLFIAGIFCAALR